MSGHCHHCYHCLAGAVRSSGHHHCHPTPTIPTRHPSRHYRRQPTSLPISHTTISSLSLSLSYHCHLAVLTNQADRQVICQVIVIIDWPSGHLAVRPGRHQVIIWPTANMSYRSIIVIAGRRQPTIPSSSSVTTVIVIAFNITSTVTSTYRQSSGQPTLADVIYRWPTSSTVNTVNHHQSSSSGHRLAIQVSGRHPTYRHHHHVTGYRHYRSSLSLLVVIIDIIVIVIILAGHYHYCHYYCHYWSLSLVIVIVITMSLSLSLSHYYQYYHYCHY